MKVSVTALALAAFFVVVQFYTSLAALSPTPPVGYVFASRVVAACMVAILVGAGAICGVRLLRERAAGAALQAPSRTVLAAWIGSAFVASVFGLAPFVSIQIVGMMLLAGVFHLALVRWYGERGAGRTMLVAYLGAGSLALAAGLAMWLVRRPATLFVLNHGRAAGVFVTANQCAAFAIVFVFIALGVALTASGRLRILGGAATAVGAVALVATFSQAGALGAAAGSIFYALAAGARRTALGLGFAAIVAAAVFSARPAVGHDASETFDRLRTWRAGVRVAELFSLTGVGPMVYYRVYPAIRQPNGDLPGTFGALHPHNAYISLAGEEGIVGLAAVAFGWWVLGRSIAGSLLARPPRERLLALGVCAGLIAALVQGIFDTIGVVQLCFVWIPYAALALAAARSGLPAKETA